MSLSIPANKTITHIQIAELVGSRDNDVKKSIKTLAAKGVISFTASPLTRTNARDGELLELSERDSYIAIAQLCPEFTAKLVDFWQAAIKEPEAPSWISNLSPQAVIAIEDMNKQIEVLADKVAEDAPKVEFVEQYVEFGESKCFRDVAAILGVKQTYFTNVLRASNIIYKKGDQYKAYSDYSKYFEVKVGTNNYTDKVTGLPAAKNYEQLRVNNAGIVYLAKRFGNPELKDASLSLVHTAKEA